MDLPINYFAVLACGVISIVLGFLWFGPLFGKLWMSLSGMPTDAMERAKNDRAIKRKIYQGYGIAFIASLIMAFVLAHLLSVIAVFDFGELARVRGAPHPRHGVVGRQTMEALGTNQCLLAHSSPYYGSYSHTLAVGRGCHNIEKNRPGSVFLEYEC
jgi:hypothetical protein